MKNFLTGCLLLWLISPFSSIGQHLKPYYLNGDVLQDNCQCYTLTDNLYHQAGAAWNHNQLDLNESFTMTFWVSLGCYDSDGSEGMAFVLQQDKNSLGTSGAGLGFSGIKPSIGITLDTHPSNTGSDNHQDPSYDHIAIQSNGDLDHRSANNLAGPVSIVQNNPDAENCLWHVLKVEWDADSKLLTAHIDSILRVSTKIDLIKSIFKNNPIVYWGMTASTGETRNRQRFCTIMTPKVTMPNKELTCYPIPIPFMDSSIAFGKIKDWYWDFGDGTKFNGQQPPPHVYPAPGIYPLTLNIFGSNGCVSDTFRAEILVGSKPTASFSRNEILHCEDLLLHFTDSSQVEFGHINKYKWWVDGRLADSLSEPDWSYEFTRGPHKVDLQVSTLEGCTSTLTSLSLPVLPSPKIQMLARDACVGETLTFTDQVLSSTPPIRQIYWDLAGKPDSTAVVSFVTTNAGAYPISSFAKGINGCPSDTMKQVINIYKTRANAGEDTVIFSGQSFLLRGSGGVLYQWSPSTGLDDPAVRNPVATLTNDQTYILKAYSPAGCTTMDTVFIKVFQGPEIFVPNAFTPNGDGLNDRLRFVPVGIKEIKSFQVFNRFGQVVYSDANPNPGWDGSVSGKKQSLGTYVWTVMAIDATGGVFRKKGTVSIVR